MSVGESLTEARIRAGMTVEEVSARSLIRETVVAAVERDDYAACGGAIYVNGYIRAIAAAIGIDPQPLIDEYGREQRPTSGSHPAASAQATEPEPEPAREPEPELEPEESETSAGSEARSAADLGSSLSMSSARDLDPAPENSAEEPAEEPAGDPGQPPTQDPSRDAPPPPGQARASEPTLEFPSDPQLPPPSYSPPASSSPRTPYSDPAAYRPPPAVSRREPEPDLEPELVDRVTLDELFDAPAEPPRVPAGAGSSAGTAASAAPPRAKPPRPRPRQQVPDQGPPRQPRTRERRRLRWAAALTVVLLAVVGLTAWQVVTRANHAQPSRTLSASSHGASSNATPTPKTSPTPSPTPQSTSRSTSPAVTLTPSSVEAFGPAGTSDGDNPAIASRAIDGSSSTAWVTNWYTTAHFGALKSGTGLLVDLGRTETITSVGINLGSNYGAALQLKTGTQTGSLTTRATASDAGGEVTMRLATPETVRYVLLWFTELPPDGQGTYMVSVYGVTIKGFRSS